MLKINEVLSLKHLWGDYLPKRLLVFIVPVGLGIHIFMEKEIWLFFWLFVAFAITTEAIKYSKCRKKHDELILRYGDKYIALLEKQIERVGVNALVDRFWCDLEPD